MDKIRIQNLTVFANHGVLPEERVLGQKFLISAELHLDTRAAGMQDDLTRTVNYAQVCSFICQQMQQTFQLIEAAAEHLAQGILREYPLVRRVDLELAKPWAPVHLPVESVSVQISRSWHRAALSMGSNLGDSRAHLDAAVRALQSDPMCRSCRMSDYLVTRPVGYTEQPDFLNGAMVLDTLYTPHELLDNLQRIEQSRHRERVIHWGPRTLDLDLIFYDDRIISDARLQVPHPEAANRFFVLKPLSELAPYWMHPVLHRTVAQLLADNPEPV
ncbi:2-amino-4-hydroxy-6-hydroxymethyldihydropteridine diphosphokinase [Ruminococcus champanellensis]|uniref:2-amino-4-hydroxy-6- hydroxymethyldihydropteridine diphosphokinase n=1 Tax=Ruminococcus champanellensis TaxID=1161942 RepID=UPI0023F201EF|nr:2-amino-4-hydroxy-6-hydroxymethyldihydropteridine diphosphokinase [Ruminococcus champanellensis]